MKYFMTYLTCSIKIIPYQEKSQDKSTKLIIRTTEQTHTHFLSNPKIL